MHTPTAAPLAPEVAGELDRIVGARAVRAVFQPLIDLGSGDVVAYEALARGPAGLLAAVARARAVGWGVALDDVGAEPASLAVLPFVHPDVVKLDLRLVQGRTTAEVARTLGATVGQGWLYGRPGRLPEGTRPPRTPLGLLPEPAAVEDQTPFEVVSAERVPERAPKDLLLPMSMHIEDKGLDAAEPGVRGASLGPDADRRFDFVITHDRDLVVRAAQPLLDRLLPQT